MIDCPICHVKNHDDARFCAECGQRLGGSAPPAGAQPPQQNRLHSPLLGGADSMAEPGAPSEVSRLRQMSSRNKDENPVGSQETPYKNPFDPRNAGVESPTQQSQSASKHKLRSPLLSGEEFDDEPPYEEENLESSSGRGLRSPLLGGGPKYAGPERRTAPTYEQFSGQERRGKHLHSPLLHNTNWHDASELQSYQDEDDEPIDENNPNVLRSPLLAAKRPLNDRPAVKSPSNSNMQTPARPTNSPEAMQFGTRPSPTSSYTSLQSISSNSAATPAPASPPPAPAAPAPSASAPPANVPAAFQNVASTPPGAASSSRAGSFAEPPATTYGAGAANQAMPPAAELPRSSEPAPRKSAPRILSDAGHETDDAFNDRSHSNSYQQPPSPIPMMIGVFAIVLLLAKLWVTVTLMSTEWGKTMFLVVDQVVGIATIVCLIVLSFTRRS